MRHLRSLLIPSCAFHSLLPLLAPLSGLILTRVSALRSSDGDPPTRRFRLQGCPENAEVRVTITWTSGHPLHSRMVWQADETIGAVKRSLGQKVTLFHGTNILEDTATLESLLNGGSNSNGLDLVAVTSLLDEMASSIVAALIDRPRVRSEDDRTQWCDSCVSVKTRVSCIYGERVDIRQLRRKYKPHLALLVHLPDRNLWVQVTAKPDRTDLLVRGKKDLSFEEVKCKLKQLMEQKTFLVKVAGKYETVSLEGKNWLPVIMYETLPPLDPSVTTVPFENYDEDTPLLLQVMVVVAISVWNVLFDVTTISQDNIRKIHHACGIVDSWYGGSMIREYEYAAVMFGDDGTDVLCSADYAALWKVANFVNGETRRPPQQEMRPPPGRH